MINLIAMIVLMCVVFGLIESALFTGLWAVLQLINKANNMYRRYHIAAFFGILLVIVLVIIKFFHFWIPYVKLLDK
jgi:hypothetical protein